MDPRAKAEHLDEDWDDDTRDFELELTEEEERELDEAIERGLADIEAGRFVPHEEVEKWLRSWGTDNELPPPKCK